MVAFESMDLHLPKVRSGKVREVYDAGEHLLIIATDRISAFDCILPTLIPGKGRVLTALSAFWFRRPGFAPNHLVAVRPAEFPLELRDTAEACAGRAMLVRRARPLPVEWVVRGYLAGSGWKEYRANGSVCGIRLPAGLELAGKLPEPILTPTTKADSGHDEPIDWDRACGICGTAVAGKARDYAMRLYEEGAKHARERGIILADTKFEFGYCGEELLLIDECMTPDSSRFWPASEWRPGANPPSFDKQYVRDYLEQSGWDKKPPAPELPGRIVELTVAKYEEALEKLAN